MIAEILDEDRKVINTIVAERDFLDDQYPGAWREFIALGAFDQAKAEKTAAVNAWRDAILTGGFTVPASASQAMAGQVLQTRDAEDKLNWKISRDAYREAVQAGGGAMMAANFRTADNTTITVSLAEGQAVLDAMQAWGVRVLGRSWEIKDDISTAPDQAALDAITIPQGLDD